MQIVGDKYFPPLFKAGDRVRYLGHLPYLVGTVKGYEQVAVNGTVAEYVQVTATDNNKWCVVETYLELVP